jgi:hypothetical protein
MAVRFLLLRKEIYFYRSPSSEVTVHVINRPSIDNTLVMNASPGWKSDGSVSSTMQLRTVLECGTRYILPIYTSSSHEL